eukprot:260866_1
MSSLCKLYVITWLFLSILVIVAAQMNTSFIQEIITTDAPFVSNDLIITDINDTISLYIYYNDSINFIDLNIHRFKKQLKYSIGYALTIFTEFESSNIKTINICSLYQHHLSSTYITDECEPSPKWGFSKQHLISNGVQSAVSIEFDFDTTDTSSIYSILDSIKNINGSILSEYIEECMNMDVSIPICSDSKYETTGNFEIINIQNEIIIIDIIDTMNENEFMFWLKKIALYLYDYCIYGIMFICLITAFIGWIHAKCNGYDCVNIMAVIIYGIYVLDFYADVIWSTHLFGEGYVWLSIASAACVVLPLLIQFVTLLIYQEQWIKDKLLREKVSGWLMLWSRKLLLFSFVSGSTYGAIELLNSNIFAKPFFSMGLTKKHLSQFNSKRLLTNIILENVPQLIIQSLYMFRYEDYEYFLEHYTNINSIDIVLLTAFISSLISILTTFITLCATHKSLNIQSKDEFIFWMVIESNIEINHKIKKCIYRRKVLEKGLKKVLNANSLEISLCYQTTEGIIIAFNVYIDKSHRDKKYKAKLTHQLNAAANFGELERMIKYVWKLSERPFVNVLTKSGCIPEINNIDEISMYNKSRQGTKRSVKLTLDLADYIVDELGDSPPNLAPLSSKTSSKYSEKPTLTIVQNSIFSVLSVSPSFIIDDNLSSRRQSFDTEPYAL